MTSRERMIAAMEGRPVDMIPMAPYFWGAEYAWKIMGLKPWELILGPRDVGLKMQEALMERHDCDWVLPLHNGSGWLEDKEVVREDSDKILFRDPKGKEWVFHMEGHWLVEAGKEHEARLDNEGADVKPPANRTEADDWIKRRFPGRGGPKGEITPDLTVRERFPDKFFCRCLSTPFADLAYALGFEPTLIMLNEDPSLCAYMIEKLMVDLAHSCAKAKADGADGGLMVDSYASADIMSPKTYTDWVAPFHKMSSDVMHKAGLKSIMYNTGNMLPLLETVRAMGYDAVTIEERIKGVEMDIGEVRKAVGPDVCLFANFDAYLLLDGDRDKIKAEVARQVGAGVSSTGRFIMGVGSPICDGTSPEAIDFWISETRKAKSA
jgi:hypothetical protein